MVWTKMKLLVSVQNKIYDFILIQIRR